MKRALLVVAGLTLLGVMALPADVSAQGRGRGRNSNWDKKCEKFVNCHDARDGRWDDRGPRRRMNNRNVFSPYSRYRIMRNRRSDRNERFYTRHYRNRRG